MNIPTEDTAGRALQQTLQTLAREMRAGKTSAARRATAIKQQQLANKEATESAKQFQEERQRAYQGMAADLMKYMLGYEQREEQLGMQSRTGGRIDPGELRKWYGEVRQYEDDKQTLITAANKLKDKMSNTGNSLPPQIERIGTLLKQSAKQPNSIGWEKAKSMLTSYLGMPVVEKAGGGAILSNVWLPETGAGVGTKTREAQVKSGRIVSFVQEDIDSKGNKIVVKDGRDFAKEVIKEEWTDSPFSLANIDVLWGEGEVEGMLNDIENKSVVLPFSQGRDTGEDLTAATQATIQTFAEGALNKLHSAIRNTPDSSLSTDEREIKKLLGKDGLNGNYTKAATAFAKAQTEQSRSQFEGKAGIVMKLLNLKGISFSSFYAKSKKEQSYLGKMQQFVKTNDLQGDVIRSMRRLFGRNVVGQNYMQKIQEQSRQRYSQNVNPSIRRGVNDTQEKSQAQTDRLRQQVYNSGKQLYDEIAKNGWVDEVVKGVYTNDRGAAKDQILNYVKQQLWEVGRLYAGGEGNVDAAEQEIENLRRRVETAFDDLTLENRKYYIRKLGNLISQSQNYGGIKDLIDEDKWYMNE